MSAANKFHIQQKRKKTPPSFLVLFIIFLFFPLFNIFAQAQDNTLETSQILFLPLQINAPGSTADLTDSVDQNLREALATRGIRLQDRTEAAAQFNYQGVWPPDFREIQNASLPSELDYVATGTVNKFGETISIDLVVYDLLAPSSPQYLFAQVNSLADLQNGFQFLIRDAIKFANRQFLIGEIDIKGNRRIDSGAILRHINNRPGDIYNPVQLRADLKEVFKMGYFDDVRIEAEDTDRGKRVIFTVSEKEVIGTVTITGEKKINETEIKEVIAIFPNAIINPLKVSEASDNIKKLYKEKGYFDTVVNIKLSYPSEGRVNISIDIQEGQKAYVKQIMIQGNTAFTDKEIEEILITSTKGIFSWFTESGVLKRDMLSQDASRIGSFYQNKGFIDVKVGEPEVEKSGEWLYVTFNVEEGQRYKTGTVNIVGDLIESEDRLLKICRIGEEKYFSRKLLREDILRLTDYYASKGYAYAEAKPAISKNDQFKRVDITLSADKGPLVYVNRIMIKGNTRTRDKVIRREIVLQETDIFNANALKASNSRVRRLEFFEDVNITPEPTEDESLMDIVVELKEKPTGSFSIGAGYSSVDNVMLMGEISQNNFLGRGQRLSLQANLSSNNTRFNLGFTEPHLNDTNLSFGADLYSWVSEYDDYTKDAKGFTVRLSHPIWKRCRIFGSYGYDDSNLTDVSPWASRTIQESKDIHVTSFISLGLSRDTRDRIYDTSNGSVNAVSVKYAGGVMGGDSAFTKIEGSTSWYFPFRWDTTFHAKLAAGYVKENSSGKLPVYEKFYLGGLSNMRGFEAGDISPEVIRWDGYSERIGGTHMWYSNLEYIFPLFKEAGLKGVIFYDMGDVFDAGDIPLGPGESVDDDSNIRQSVGFGFRWLSPMGPLRLEWGYNLNPEDDEDQSLWDFSIGGQF